MKSQLQDEIFTLYPELFVETRIVNDKRPNYPIGLFGIEIEGDGWFGLLKTSLKTLDDYAKKYGKDIQISQIKEKFGELRIHLSQESDFDATTDNILRSAEAASSFICEITGRPGALGLKGSTYKTICEEIAEKEGYTYV